MAVNPIKAAITDVILTFLWMCCASSLGIGTTIIAAALGIQGSLTLVITTVLIAAVVFVFNFIGELLGGASFNPTGTILFYAAGLGDDSLFSMALRFPAQAVGAVGGALAMKELMPIRYQHMLGGPALKVDAHTGAIAEGVLTFVISLAVLIIIFKVSGGPMIKTWLIAVATVAMIIAGANYTGPSMNPVNAFGWAYVNDWHNTWEQFYVYWICPFVGAVLAAWVFRFLFPQPKMQKAHVKKE
uniref:Aquaporin SIP n=1 Tax=Tamarix hispida TaxID=189793 RepID=A0A145PRF6_9CARY|nr:aquaporin SIP [Tamarix hispida]